MTMTTKSRIALAAAPGGRAPQSHRRKAMYLAALLLLLFVGLARVPWRYEAALMERHLHAYMYRDPHYPFRHHNNRGHVDDDAYFVQAANAYGGYSNMRRSLLNSMAFAAYLNRTLVYSPFANCLNDEIPEMLFDLSPLRVQPIVANLKPMCNPQRPTLTSSSMIVRKFCPGPYVCLREGSPPEGGPASLKHSNYSHPEAYFTGGFLWRPRHPRGDAWTLAELASISSGETTRCVGLQEGFYFRLDPADGREFWPYYERAHRSLLPSKRIRKAADAFLKKHGLASRPFAAIHLRLTDLGGRAGLNGLDCTADVHGIVDKTKSYGQGMPVLLATDDLTSRCARVVVEGLQPIIVESGVWDPRSCSEAAFVQEVMGHASAFVGVSNSTFSGAIEGIRLYRYNRRTRGHLFSV